MGCLKSKTKRVPTPWTLTTSSRQEWIAWKSCFLTYVQEMYIPTYKQGNYFMQYIGDVGQEILRNFYFPNASSETDIDTLMFKFDVYFIFGNRRRHDNESIEDYVQALKVVAEKTAKSNTEKAIKEKILQDLVSEKLFEKFQRNIESFSKIADYESLNLNELMFIWKECVETHKFEMIEPKQNHSLKDNDKKHNCFGCDTEHQYTKCPAIGNKCLKCEGFNHFTNCCLKTFISECGFCGSSHVQNKCPAFAKECSKCRKMNHFSWKCFSEMILSCDFCGQNHINNRQKCPAINSVCGNCNKKGHYSHKCRSRKNSKKRY